MIRLIGTTWKHSDVLSEGVLIGRVPMGNGVHRPKCPKLTHCFVARAKNNTHWTLLSRSHYFSGASCIASNFEHLGVKAIQFLVEFCFVP